MPRDLNRLEAHLAAALADVAAWANDPNAGPMRNCRARDANALRAAIGDFHRTAALYQAAA